MTLICGSTRGSPLQAHPPFVCYIAVFYGLLLFASARFMRSECKNFYRFFPPIIFARMDAHLIPRVRERRPMAPIILFSPAPDT